MDKIVVVTGGFDPLHRGHIEYFTSAKNLGDQLVVGVNSDQWLERKKGRKFMSFEDRLAIVQNIRGVTCAIGFDDSDNTAIDAIIQVRKLFPRGHIIFANGGDRTSDNIPEMSCDISNLEFKFGVGGEHKLNSSSWILDEWRAPKTERPWGEYRVLHEVDGTKVKELTVNPGQALSVQRHEYRSEYWMVTEGQCEVYSYHDVNQEYLTTVLHHHGSLKIKKGTWHQLRNPYDTPCRIVEIQYGTQCVEEDIERR